VSPTAPNLPSATLAQRIAALLPQTQCTRCGYPDCRAYAEAVASDAAPLNQCPPGGAEGIRQLAALLGLPELPLNPEFGDEGPRRVVYIEEATCIGCTLCIQACPVDAIVGAPKRMHAVIGADCTGCELCLPVCPMDCIALEDASAGATGRAAWSPAQADAARARYAGRQARLARDDLEHDEHLNAKGTPPAPTTVGPKANAATTDDPKRAAIAAALARARLRAKARPQ
jgi:electron transport complex protein RnfB